MGKPRYRRVLVKVSGEALMGDQPSGLHPPRLARIATDLAKTKKLGVQIAVVVGGGNFLRGAHFAESGIDGATADQMGMLATVMNALALEAASEKAGPPSRTLSAILIPSVCGPYSRQLALKHLSAGRIV